MFFDFDPLTPTPMKNLSCRECDGAGTIPGAMHYVGLGTSQVTFCPNCPQGHQCKADWTMAPQQVAYRRRLAQAKVRRALEASQLGLAFANARLEDFEQSPAAHQILERYLSRWPGPLAHGEGLYLYGPPGVGKTHALTALARELIEAHLVETLILSVPALGTRLRQLLSASDSFRREALLAQMKQVQLLILDDLGLEKHSAWLSDLLAQVIDERWRMRRPVLLASAFPPERLAHRYSAQMLSRVRAMCHMLGLEGPDRRTPS